MELDDLKNTWQDITNQVSKQQHLTPQKIDQMTKNKYDSTLRKIAYPEIVGILICLAGAVYIMLNFGKLNTVYLQVTGIVSILLLLILSAISFVSIRRLNTAVDLDKPYAETLRDFATQKIKFHKLQKINITLSYLLLVTIIILFSKFFSGKDITDSKYFWTFSFSFGYIFLLFYSKWVSKYYRSTLRKSEDLLKELIS